MQSCHGLCSDLQRFVNSEDNFWSSLKTCTPIGGSAVRSATKLQILTFAAMSRCKNARAKLKSVMLAEALRLYGTTCLDQGCFLMKAARSGVFIKKRCPNIKRVALYRYLVDAAKTNEFHELEW